MTNLPTSERINFIGASECAALFNESPYQTRFQLWHEKAGTIAPKDLDDVERIQAGKFMEPAIAEWAQAKWGLKIRKVNRYIKHPEINGMGASLDYETIQGHYPVEIKNVDGLIFKSQWQAEGDMIVEAPLHILLQCQHQLACAGKDKFFLIVCVSGNRLYQMAMERRPKTVKRIEWEIKKFWLSIKHKQEPPIDYVEDYETIKELYANFGDDVVDLTGDNRLTDLCHTYKSATAKRKIWDDQAKGAMSEILSKINPSEKEDMRKKIANIDGFTITSSYIGERDVSFKRAAHRRINISEVQNDKK